MSTNVTKSGRVTKKPERFSELSFLGGSGFVGCDAYDRNYNNGYTGYYGREEYKDRFDERQDKRFENDLQNCLFSCTVGRPGSTAKTLMNGVSERTVNKRP